MIFYRYEIHRSVLNNGNDGECSKYSLPLIINTSLELLEFDLIKETSKGYWIGYANPFYNYLDWKKWIPKISKKRFAYPTKKEAMLNFVKRTEKRIKILTGQISHCKTGLNIAKKTLV